MGKPNRSVPLAISWTPTPNGVLVEMHSGGLGVPGSSVVAPFTPAMLRAMLACAEGGATAKPTAQPLIPHGHPQRAYAEALYRWLTEDPNTESAFSRSLSGDVRERWSQVVWCWLHDVAQHPSAGAISPLPDPLPRPAENVTSAAEAVDAPNLLPVTLDGWPSPDSDESAALWNLRRILMLLRECARIGPVEAIALYRTDIRDWCDRLEVAIRHFRKLEAK